MADTWNEFKASFIKQPISDDEAYRCLKAQLREAYRQRHAEERVAAVQVRLRQHAEHRLNKLLEEMEAWHAAQNI